MRTVLVCLVVWLLYLLGSQAHAQPTPRAVETQRAADATAWLERHLYLRETNGYNRALLIDQ